MIDTIIVGSAPADELCAELGQPDYETSAMAECLAYIEALRAVHGLEPDGVRLRTLWLPYGDTRYLQVACDYDGAKPEARRYAARVEDGLDTWAQAGMTPQVPYHEDEEA